MGFLLAMMRRVLRWQPAHVLAHRGMISLDVLTGAWITTHATAFATRGEGSACRWCCQGMARQRPQGVNTCHADRCDHGLIAKPRHGQRVGVVAHTSLGKPCAGQGLHECLVRAGPTRRARLGDGRDEVGTAPGIQRPVPVRGPQGVGGPQARRNEHDECSEGAQHDKSIAQDLFVL
jgi:hypothetical protein